MFEAPKHEQSEVIRVSIYLPKAVLNCSSTYIPVIRLLLLYAPAVVDGCGAEKVHSTPAFATLMCK